jgi:hypothetical protein
VKWSIVIVSNAMSCGSKNEMVSLEMDMADYGYLGFSLVLQSGCCKPPTDCQFTFDNATTWVGTPGSTDTDCRAWSNDQAQLCFDCNSCRAGLLQNVKSNWRKVAVVNIIVLVFIIFVYSCGCCALKASRREKADRKYRYGYP